MIIDIETIELMFLSDVLISSDINKLLNQDFISLLRQPSYHFKWYHSKFEWLVRYYWLDASPNDLRYRYGFGNPNFRHLNTLCIPTVLRIKMLVILANYYNCKFAPCNIVD